MQTSRSPAGFWSVLLVLKRRSAYRNKSYTQTLCSRTEERLPRQVIGENAELIHEFINAHRGQHVTDVHGCEQVGVALPRKQRVCKHAECGIADDGTAGNHEVIFRIGSDEIGIATECGKSRHPFSLQAIFRFLSVHM